MGNAFINYLNSLHNDLASNQNAIAELAISSPFFEGTQVKRDIAGFLKEKIDQQEMIVLTGHAGDGKTTVLAQILELCGHKVEKLLPTEDIQLNNGGSLHYIKDFSELVSEDQDRELLKCFGCEGASLLIANTGPLLGAFKRLGGEGTEEKLLEAMDKSEGGQITIDTLGSAFILNIARVDNTDFIKPFLENILKEEHWKACESCPNAQKCPIYFNKQIVLQRLPRVTELIENIYIWLQEYDLRTTIRQMTAHLTFSLTGGLNCDLVERNAGDQWKYNYLFSNLFCGYKGKTSLKDALQIRGITLVRDAGFDRKQTCMDYDLHTCNDYSEYFPDLVAKVLDLALNSAKAQSKVEALPVLKRAYLFFGHNTDEIDQLVQKQVFSEWFKTYLNVRNNGIKPKGAVTNAIFHAINTLFVGVSSVDGISEINLTLRRNNEQLRVSPLNGTS